MSSPRVMDVPVCCPPRLQGSLDDAAAAELAAVLKVLADPVRLRLIALIADAAGGEICACDLQAQVGRSQPTVSHHLGQLVKAGVLEREQRGKWAWFRLRAGALASVGRALDMESALDVH